MACLKKILNYFQNTVTPIDLLKSKFCKQKGKIKIGWCSVFPPIENGAAAFSYYFVKELMKNSEFEVYAIPVNNKIKKSAFKGIKFAKINNKKLDVVVFWCLGDLLPKYFNKCKCKKIAWQTMHYTQESEKLMEYLKKCDNVLFPTKSALKWHNLPNAQYLPLGTKIELFKTKKSDREIIFVSRSHYYKGMIPFLQTIPLVVNKHANAIFRLHSPIDKNTPHKEEIQKTIEEMQHRFPNNFFFENKWQKYKEMPSIYENAGILLFPSNNEGFGVPLVEAMASETVCIVPDAAPMNELVLNNKTGFCIKYERNIEQQYHGFKFPHPKDMANKINYLLDNFEILDKMKKNSKIRAEKEYSMKKCVSEFTNIVKKVLNETANN